MVARGDAGASDCQVPLRRPTRLNQHAKGPAKVFRVSQSLKLASVRGSPFAKRRGIFPNPLRDPSQELCLRRQSFGLQTGGLADELKRGEIDMGSQVLLAGV